MSGQLFTIELTEAELLNAWMQAERALFDTLDDIDRGRCTEADAAVQRSLYRALCKAVYARQAERNAIRAAPPSGAGVMAACGHADTHPTQAVTGAAEPLPAKPVLTLEDAALPGAARSLRARPPASSGRPDSEGLL